MEPPTSTNTLTPTRVQDDHWLETGPLFVSHLEDLAWNRDWAVMHDSLDHVMQNHHRLNWTLHPAAFCGVVELVLRAPAPPLDLVQRIYYQLAGKYAFLTTTACTQVYPLHALVSSGSRHLSVVNIVQFLGAVAPETSHLRCQHQDQQRPIDIVVERLLVAQQVAAHGSLSRAPPPPRLYQDDYYKSNKTSYMDPSSLSQRQWLDDDEFLWTCAYHLVRMMMVSAATATTPTESTNDSNDTTTSTFLTPLTSPSNDMVHCCIQARHLIPFQLLELALERFAHQLSEPQQGNLPLHLAVMPTTSHANDSQLLSILLERYPHAACVTNAAGRLPLQIAVQTGQLSQDVLAPLIECSPAGLLTLMKRESPQEPLQQEQPQELPQAAVDGLLLTKLCEERRCPGTVFLLLQRHPHWITDNNNGNAA